MNDEQQKTNSQFVMIVSLLFGAALATTSDVLTPWGRVPRECYHEVPSGAQLARIDGGGMLVSDSNGSPLRVLKACEHNLAQKRSVGAYDGWLAYTQFENPG